MAEVVVLMAPIPAHGHLNQLLHLAVLLSAQSTAASVHKVPLSRPTTFRRDSNAPSGQSLRSMILLFMLEYVEMNLRVLLKNDFTSWNRRTRIYISPLLSYEDERQ